MKWVEIALWCVVVFIASAIYHLTRDERKVTP